MSSNTKLCTMSVFTAHMLLENMYCNAHHRLLDSSVVGKQMSVPALATVTATALTCAQDAYLTTSILCFLHTLT